MSSAREYGPPLDKMIDVMARQMAQQENIERPSWLSDEKSLGVLLADLDRNVQKLRMAYLQGDVEAVWRRAANVGNFAWMVAARLEGGGET